MALQATSLVDGVWVTRPVDINTILSHHNRKDEDEEASRRNVYIDNAPPCGILTQTVIRSPLVHWILPVTLRNSDRNDVAFIGDDFVQIKELRPDRQLWDVVRKENFGARIRNARAFGSMKDYRKEEDGYSGTQIKEEDTMIMDTDSHHMIRNGQAESLCPQFIVLQLDTGDSVFLMLRKTDVGELKLVSSRHRVPKPMLGLQPGMHLTVDPSSRYIAVGCSENLFTVYAIHSRAQLLKHYVPDSPLRFVESNGFFNTKGIILKMEFLYPSADDEDHMILLVLVVVSGKTRMMRYEWAAGDDLAKVRPRTTKGHRLAASRQMPVLLIPLIFKSAFILIFETFMSVCQNILEDSPTFIDFNSNPDPPTNLYHGKGKPLFTAWTRPTRLVKHTKHRDDIYIVREDGALKLLEIDSELEELMQLDHPVGPLEGNCGTALASLDYNYPGSENGDMLITGGDSCSGGTYLIRARQLPLFIEPTQNWSPSPDFITTHIADEQAPSDEYDRGRRQRNFFPKPDQIFVCAGKGSRGVITEFRYGLEAKLGLEMDYQMPIMEAWVLCPDFDSLDGDDDDTSLFLLSMGDRSAVLRLSSDAKDVTDIDQDNTKFDLRYRTLAASNHRNFTIQVTEQSIVLINGSLVHRHENDELLVVREGGVMVGQGQVIGQAIIHEDQVLFTTHVNDSVYLQILEQRDADDMETDGVSTIEPRTNVRTLGKYSQQVTALAVCRIEQNLYAIVAELRDKSIFLGFNTIQGTAHTETSIPLITQSNIPLDPVVSIAVTYWLPRVLTVLCGTRNGFLITVDIDERDLQFMGSRYDRIGVGQITVKKDVQHNSGELFFVGCDSNIFALTPSHSQTSPSVTKHSMQGWAINQLWLTDALKPGLQQPDITSIARLRPSLSGDADGGLLLVAGTQLLLASFGMQTKSVPRHIPVGGTPTRLLYSHAMGLLIVGAIVDRKTTLLFIDPKTGKDISVPTNWDTEQSTLEVTDHISGLGRVNEKIYHLLDWSFVKENKTWNFIVVGTSSGRLLIVSTKSEERRQKRITSANGAQLESDRKLCYYTRHTLRLPRPEPVYAVTGFLDGLLWCSGHKLICEILDIKVKKFKRVAEYELPSPATTITCDYEHGFIYALTACHSLEILKFIVHEGGKAEITRLQGDQITRNSLHHASVDCDMGGRPMHMVSDKHCSVVGLWPTLNTKADTLETMFEAELPHSILKFRPGKCRPIWDPSWTSSGVDSSKICPRNANVTADTEVLGLSIDGSLTQFTPLTLCEWKFLRFLINLAIRSPKMCEFTYKDDTFLLEPATSPKRMMHIDGDILKRCLAERTLEELLQFGQETEQAAQILSKFYDLLLDLHNGPHNGSTSLALEEGLDAAVYVEQAYRDLEFYLRPAL
ncbi:hypothetical protein LSUE1_G004225 [Lachnellula suecica]|uniref:RSE1/DDB1/CPSF1 first beta-propeller domain-containing protein n=1 Tax=Lachnellula suecica TaxID=602035 RepID=A0A8T9C596_9HELO|nr:hypothetical protein LSUE1_G004225 [Lachnellula suecica]